MSNSPRRRQGANCVAGAHARQTSADFHEGSKWDFLRRHEVEASNAARGGRQERKEFAKCLLTRASDTRNILCAIENLTREDDKAPGPNGVRLELLDKHERGALARGLNQAMQDGTYRPGPVRRKPIQKTSGVGFRTLEIPNAEDKVAQRAIAQVVQPFLDPTFDERSFGFRPHRGRENALAAAQLLAERNGRWVWIQQDLANAFTQVPHGRLADVIRLSGQPTEMLELTLQAVSNAKLRGLPQGGPLSPLLLNWYLDHFLDRPWRRRFPLVPLIRVADDILIICRDLEEAQETHAYLEQLTRDAATPLKYARNTAIRRLREGQHADWLGYRLTHGDRGMEAQTDPRSLDGLADHLMACHAHAHPTLRAIDTTLGWFDQLGPTYRHVDREATIARVRDIAGSMAFEETPSPKELQDAWERSYSRYRCVRRAYALSWDVNDDANGDAGGSARQHRDSADFGRGGGAPTVGASPPFLNCALFTDGSCVGGRDVGGWAYILDGPQPGQRTHCSGSSLRSTNNRMELTAVIEGLESIEMPARVQITTDSMYVYDGLSSKLQHWQQGAWRRSDGGRLANAALWRRLLAQLDRHQVTINWVRGHSGHPENELCDQLANQAVHDRRDAPIRSPHVGGSSHREPLRPTAISLVTPSAATASDPEAGSR